MRVTAFVLVLASISTNVDGQLNRPREFGFEPSPTLEFGDRWMRAGWSRKDPFEDDRKRFEAAPPSRQKLEEETRGWERKLPTSATEAYRFGSAARLLAVAAYQEDYRTIGWRRMRATISAAARAMARHPADNSAEFARMRFLLEVRNWPRPELVPLARRLVEQFPERPGLRLHLATLLQFSTRQENLREALAVARALVRDHPDPAEFQLLLAMALSSAGQVLRDRGLLEEAIEQHERCLRMPEMSATRKQMVRANLETLRKRLRELEG